MLVLDSRGAGGKHRHTRRVRRGFTSVPLLPMTNADDLSANAIFGFKIQWLQRSIIVATLLSTFLSAQSALELAKSYYQKGNYKRAKALLTKEAHRGNIEAELSLAKIYKKGIGTAPSNEKALYWYKKACKTSSDACYQAAKIYEEANRSKEMLQYYQKAINKKSTKALFALATLYYNGKLLKKDIPQAIKLYKKAAKKGDTLSSYNLGYIYEHGIGVDKDFKKAFVYYSKAAKKGYIDAAYNLATLYYLGKGVKKDPQKAFEWYKRAALQGDSEALYNVGLMYYKGEGVLKNKIFAFQYWLEAAKKSHQKAQDGLDRLCKESPWACR